jgi:hypothetical protein
LEIGPITNSYATANVSGDEEVGGLVGFVDGPISNCYCEAVVSGNDYIGGLVGWNHGTITNCYSKGGSVSGNRWFGGLVGYNGYRGTVMDSFWDIQTSAQTDSAGGTGLTTTEMQTAATFLQAGWDFVGETENGTEDIWAICEGTNYPRLVWQIPVGDFVCPDGVTMPDFSLFATRWLDDNCDSGNDYCEGTDLDLSGAVDINDLETFADNWLGGVEN